MKRLALIVFASLCLVAAGAFQARAFAAVDVFQQPCTESGGQGSVCIERNKAVNPDGDNPIYGKGGIIAKAMTIINIIIGAASVIMIIIGGFKFVLSNGDSNQVTSARNTILYAVVGLVIAALAQTIVFFVLNKL